MAMTLTGKIVSAILLLGVIAGMAVVITLVVQDANRTAESGGGGGGDGGESGGGESGAVTYEVGVGIADMTGPIVEITFMGYAELSQRGTGLHTRQFSRAFIFSQGGSRVVLVSAEIQSVGIAVRREVIKNLQELYGDIYDYHNVIIAGTHTHSTPGGYLVDFLLDVSILGFSSETYNAYVDGITRSIIRAHENMVPARLFFGQTQVLNAHMNRSPYSYNYNPPEERARYPTDTDTTLSQIKIVKEDGSLHGVLNWFAVHTTSMNMSNTLVSSDNLGYAALRLEKDLNPGLPTGQPEIVAAFFEANHGDVSPNTRGARCEFSGDECDNQFLLCEALERCYSLGPGDDMFQSTQVIGTAAYEGALEVLNQPGEELTGSLAVVHQFVEIGEEVVPRYDPVTRTFNVNEPVSGCVPAMGYSFASGTIDGANVLNITQGTIQGNPLLDTISGVLAEPTADDVECHAPKPILLATGRANFPIPWHPHIASVSIIKLGDAIVAGVPGEPTTMAGRRVRDVIGDVTGNGPEKVLVTGLTNEYIHYVSTYEEYQVQRYEAASTIYGPNTLDILLNKFSELTTVGLEGGTVPLGPIPEDYRNNTISLILPVLFDGTPLIGNFGDVVEQPQLVVSRGDVVSATFIAANPRNNLRQESTHAVVEGLILGQWEVIANDADWETRFYWERSSTIAGTSQATFTWEVPSDALLTSYRIRYFGRARRLVQGDFEFVGLSREFLVQA